MQAESAVTTWEKTPRQNLVRHKSGRYYARLDLNGKEIWKSPKTSHYSVAESRLASTVKEHREKNGRAGASANARMTFADAAQLHMQRLDENVSIKRRTRTYWREILAALVKSWSTLSEMEIRRVTTFAYREWAARYAKIASATRFNETISLPRHVIEVAIESGVLYSNPARAVDRKPVRAKKLETPTRSHFAAFIAEMRAGHGRDSVNCADLAEGIAFTGCRIAESTQIEWRDLDFAAADIVVKGDPEERIKNGEICRVPMIPQTRELFTRMREARPDEPLTEKVFLVRECQKSTDRAAKKVGMARITHHDLFFATVSIESGVDIPTVCVISSAMNAVARALRRCRRKSRGHRDRDSRTTS
jgi:integrase